MRVVVLSLALVFAGCSSVQKVTECTMEDRHDLRGPLEDQIFNDVIDGWNKPSKALLDLTRILVRDYGTHVVRCSLREIINRLRSKGNRSLDDATMYGIALELERTL